MKKVLQSTRGERILRWSMFATVLGLGVLALWANLTNSEPRELEAGSDLVLRLGRLKTNTLLLYRYPVSPSVIAPVAVQKGLDGIVRAALATCRRCPKSSNYEWSGKLVCGHCQHVMKMPDPGKKPDVKDSGCVLRALGYEIAGDSFSVRGDTIKAEFLKQLKSGWVSAVPDGNL
jgi:hypothetical protein